MIGSSMNAVEIPKEAIGPARLIRVLGMEPRVR
jgi:hypothetical protein